MAEQGLGSHSDGTNVLTFLNYFTPYRAASGWLSGSHTSPPLFGEAEGAKGAEPAMHPSAQKQDSDLEVILVLSKL